MTALVSLTDAERRHGGKAAALGALLRAGFAVPAGVVIPHPLRDGWCHRLSDALDDMGPGPYAVRSSGHAEDGVDASFAGQLHTTLSVSTGTALMDAVARTAASADPAAQAYAARLGCPHVGEVSVIVQQMVDADVAGVLFTRDPVTSAEQLVIEATRGLGVSVVDGSSIPERWVVAAGTFAEHPGDGPAALCPHQVQELADLGRRVEALFDFPQDIEWAIAGDRTWVLQSRPVTGARSPATPSTISDVTADRPLVTGTPASPGRAVGTPRAVADLDQFGRFRPGDILVCHATSPAWTPLLACASAVVTESGGILSHAAIVAREFGIPAVVAAPGAMSKLSGQHTVIVDGSTGVVAAVLAATEVR